MATTINPRYINSNQQSHADRRTPEDPESSFESMDGEEERNMDDDRASPSPSRSLPGRCARSAAAHAHNRSLLRIDTEQFKSLSLHDTCGGGRSPRPPPSAAELQQWFQRYRELLWRHGREHLGNTDTAHNYIAPAHLPARAPAPDRDRLTAFAMVHSHGRSPVGLRREFNRHMLHATLPEPCQTPATPNFDREEVLSAIADTRASGRRRYSSRSPSARRETRGRRGSPHPMPPGIPMHLQYARSHLPVLAAIMMNEQVRVGDTIQLPLPHPEEWSETVAWVYTGERELATEWVEENVRYLGGKVSETKIKLVVS